MLPVSSSPNTMIYPPSGMTSLQMAKLGFGITIMCMVVVIVSIMTYGYIMFDLGTFPNWANATDTENIEYREF